jgi:hypothetical protein
MAYVGTPLDTTNAFQSLAGKRFSGDGSTTDFTLDSSPNSTLDIEVFVGNVRQDPNSAYTVSGTTLGFTGAPPSGTNNIYVVHQAKAVGTIGIPDDTVSSQTDIGGAIADADLFLVDDGAGGTLRKTAASRLKTYVGGPDPSSADGDSLGTASLEWSDLYLADGGIIYFGNDQDVTLTHDPDDGLFLKSIATADNNPVLLTLQTGETDMAADDVIGKIAFQAPDEGTGTDAILVSAAIQAVAEGDHSSSSNATSLQFMTGASEAAAEKMRVSSNGTIAVGHTGSSGSSLTGTGATGVYLSPSATTGASCFASVGDQPLTLNRADDTTNNITLLGLRRQNSVCGTIKGTNTTAQYNTSSDYRLKENVDYTWDATTRFKQLKPARFNWIVDKTNTLVDGFLAHEVTSIVPQAISGEKDAVDSEGNIDPQGIDHSHLVPLLTKALQEAITKIETLETEMTSLKARVKTLEDA